MEWYNEITKLFMGRGYIRTGQTIDEKINEIARHSTNILKKDEAYYNKLRKYIIAGHYVIPTPVWKNFHPHTLETPISCLTGDSWINTKHEGGTQIKDLSIGDEVLTHKGRFRKVTNKQVRDSNDDLFELKVQTRKTPIKITGNHPVLTNLGWVRVDELNPEKHFIATNTKVDYEEKPYTLVFKNVVRNNDGMFEPTIISDVEIDEDLSWALGLWFAEGSQSVCKNKKPNGIRLTMGEPFSDSIIKWKDIICSKFGINGNIYKSEVVRNGKINNWLTCNINSTILGDKFKEEFGVGCKDKNLPIWLKELPVNLLKKFFEGFYLGDGRKTHETQSFTIANPKLAMSLYELGLKCGFRMGLQMQEKAGKLSTTRYVYSVSIYCNQGKINMSVNNARSGILFSDENRYCPFGLTKLTHNEPVYDITVEEDHSFSVCGVVVHNCFGVFIEDTVESIVLKAAEVALQNKIGGGSSGSFQDVRPRGSKIGTEGHSNGSVSMMEIFQTVSATISQPNRRGHFSATQDIEHGDAMEFMGARSEGHALQTISTGIKASDHFMNSLLDGDEEAIEKFRVLVESKFHTGFHYTFFTDTVNRNTVDVYKDKGYVINHSNMCQPKSATLLRKDDSGIKIIKMGDLGVGDTIWSGKEWTKVVKKWSTGTKKVYKYNTSTGYFLGTDNHKVFSSGVKIEVGKASTLDWSLCKYPLSKDFNTLDIINGLMIGDGSVHKASNNLMYLNIGEKDYDYFDSEIKDLIIEHRSGIGKTAYTVRTSIDSDELPKTYNRLMPERYYYGDEKTKRGFLRGLFSANGSVVGGRVVLTQSSKKLIEQVRELLSSLGIHSYMTSIKPKVRKFKNGYYTTKECYSLNITSGKELFKKHIGFIQEYKMDKIGKSNENRYFTSDIQDVQYIGKEEVFEITVEAEEHSYWTGGVLVSNCQEIALPNSAKETFVCNLLGMNMVNFDEWKDTDAVEIGIYFMDSMLTDFIDKTESKKAENEDYYNVLYKPSVDFAKKHRAMGMGKSGLHTYLQSKMIPFDSIMGRTIDKMSQKLIHDQAYAASRKMAIEYGKPELLKEDKYDRRHTTLLAVAPNTSSSFIMGQSSQSIEPIVSNYYIKDVAKVRMSFRNPNLEVLLEEKGQNTPEVWLSILKNEGSVQHLDFLSKQEKDVFKTFIEMNQLSIIEMAADRQKYIDQSQSLNIMIGKNTTPEDVAYLMIKAWKLGVKTLYYQLNVNSAQDFTNKRSNASCEACEA